MIQHHPLNGRETRFVIGMERDRSDPSRSIRHQEIFEPQPGKFWFSGSRPMNAIPLLSRKLSDVTLLYGYLISHWLIT